MREGERGGMKRGGDRGGMKRGSYHLCFHISAVNILTNGDDYTLHIYTIRIRKTHCCLKLMQAFKEMIPSRSVMNNGRRERDKCQISCYIQCV